MSTFVLWDNIHVSGGMRAGYCARVESDNVVNEDRLPRNRAREAG